MTILSVASEKQASAKAIGDASSIPTSTLYRRLECLVAANVIDEQTHLDDDGNHYTVYEANLESVEISVGEGRVVAQASFENSTDRTHVWQASG